MTGITAPVPAPADDSGPAQPGQRPGRRWLATGGTALALVVAGFVAAEVTGAFAGSGSAGTAGSNPYHVTTAPVRRQSLIAQTQLRATLDESGSYSVVNQAQGTFTALPDVGSVVSEGQSLYSVDGSPVVLLYGRVPAWRSLAAGMTGPDVAELNTALAALGYASRPSLRPADYFSSQTALALQALQARLGVPETATLALGQAVFLPTAALITAVGQTAVLGGPAMPGTVLLSATSTTRLVTIALDPSMQGEVRAGDSVSITLPSGLVTSGVVSSVAAVATASQGASGGTIVVQVRPTRAAQLGGLEQAPVEVTLTTARVTGALVVPVDALLAQASGGYAVEVTGPRGPHLVPVTTGLFDDAVGVVQVDGRGLASGQRVVVPSV